MKMRILLVCTLAVGAVMSAAGFGQELKPIPLPKPQMEGRKTVMQALAERKTMREFSDQRFFSQMLSNLLWAAFGVNRGKADRPGSPAMRCFLYGAQAPKLTYILVSADGARG